MGQPETPYEMRAIPTELVQTLINYLQQQPYNQVYRLISALASLPPQKPEMDAGEPTAFPVTVGKGPAS